MRRLGFVGIDETVPVETLLHLSEKHKHLELGICLAYQGSVDQPNPCFVDSVEQSTWPATEKTWWSKLGGRRYDDNGRQRMYGYPGWTYLEELKKYGQHLRLSLHLNEDKKLSRCSYVTSLAAAEPWILETLRLFAEGCAFLRVQVNFTAHGIPLQEYDNDPEEKASNVVSFAKELGPKVQFVIPFKGTPGPFIQSILTKAKDLGLQECFSLFHDPSAGSGTSSDHFFDPDSMGLGLFCKSQWMGYAGGLSQENCTEKAALMSAATNGRPCWTDMQTNVREKTTLVAKPDEPVPDEPRRHRYFGKVDVAVIDAVCAAVPADIASGSNDLRKSRFANLAAVAWKVMERGVVSNPWISGTQLVTFLLRLHSNGCACGHGAIDCILESVDCIVA